MQYTTTVRITNAACIYTFDGGAAAAASCHPMHRHIVERCTHRRADRVRFPILAWAADASRQTIIWFRLPSAATCGGGGGGTCVCAHMYASYATQRWWYCGVTRLRPPFWFVNLS